MAKDSLQEKFQVSIPTKERAGEPWADVKSVRRTRPIRGSYSDGLISDFSLGPKNDQNVHGYKVDYVNEASAGSDPAAWTDLQEWVLKENGGMPLVTAAGDGDVTKIPHNRIAKGFEYMALDGADDQYTGENQDHFYGEAVGTDDSNEPRTGFVERNNYLDRLALASIFVIPLLSAIIGSDGKWSLFS